jgi:hypothetical protein
MERLTILMDEPSNARENQLRRDAWMAFKKAAPVWQNPQSRCGGIAWNPPKKKSGQEGVRWAGIGGYGGGREQNPGLPHGDGGGGKGDCSAR